MTAAPDRSQCQHLERWLTAYLDDELDAVHILDVEAHLELCEWCNDQIALARATRCSLRRVTQNRAPSALRAQICATLAQEAETSSGASEPPRPQLVKVRYVVPLAVAAMLTMVFGAIHARQQKEAKAGYSAGITSAGIPVANASFETFLDDLVAQHAKPPPFEVTDAKDLKRFDPYLGVHVKQPQYSEVGAQFGGARLHRQRAAMLHYVLSDHRRFTLYMFDSRRVPIKSSQLHQRHVGARRVYVGRVRGYTVAAREADGVGMAIAADLDDKKTTELLLMAAR